MRWRVAREDSVTDIFWGETTGRFFGNQRVGRAKNFVGKSSNDKSRIKILEMLQLKNVDNKKKDPGGAGIPRGKGPPAHTSWPRRTSGARYSRVWITIPWLWSRHFWDNN